MKNATVTILIPTLNRARFLGQAIDSVLKQTYSDLILTILDNASTDDTKAVVQSFSDPRIGYICNKHQLSMIENWNQAIKLCDSDYVCILGDDDRLFPQFLEKSLTAINSYPSVGFTFSHCNKVDSSGNFMQRWGYNFPPCGLMRGHDYLELTLKHRCCLTNSSTVLIRKSVLDSVGFFQSEYSSNTFDFNLWIRIASQFDTYFIDEVLADYRIHEQQISERHWRTPNSPTGSLGTTLELLSAIALLLKHKNDKPEILSDCIVRIATQQAEMIKIFIPDL